MLVIGGGIAGLSLAHGLLARGHAVRVFERHPAPDPGGSGLVLSPNGILAADRLSPELGSQLRRLAPAAEPFRYLSPSGREKGRDETAAVEQAWQAPMVPIRRQTLYGLLRAPLPPDVLVTGARFEQLSQDGHRVTARFADGREARGDLLVGADGLRSQVREQVVPGLHPRYLGCTSLRGLAPLPIRSGFLTQGPGLQLFTAPLRDGSSYWAATVNAPEGSWTGLAPGAARQRLAALTAGWHDPVPAMVAATPESALVLTDTYELPMLPRWTDGRVALIGDAAHPMAPFLGQGANAALEDAAALAHRLHRSTPAEGPQPALAGFEAARRERVARMVAMSRRLGQVGQLENRLALLLRDAAMTLAFRLGAGRQVNWLYDFEV